MVSASALISKQSSITGLHELFKQKSHHQMCLLLRRVDNSTCCIHECSKPLQRMQTVEHLACTHIGEESVYCYC